MERRDRRGRRIGYNWWREWIVSEWFDADQAWWSQCEAVAYGYQTEITEYKKSHPRPTLKSFMINLATPKLGD